MICCPQAGRALTFTLDAKVSKTSRQKNAPTAQAQRLPRFFADPALSVSELLFRSPFMLFLGRDRLIDLNTQHNTLTARLYRHCEKTAFLLLTLWMIA